MNVSFARSSTTDEANIGWAISFLNDAKNKTNNDIRLHRLKTAEGYLAKVNLQSRHDKKCLKNAKKNIYVAKKNYRKKIQPQNI